MEEKFHIKISGIAGKNAKIKYYDPLLDKDVAANVVSRQGDSAVVNLSVADYPRLLLIEE